ncbi:MAG: putative porin [Balneolaceae bacterium]
MLPLLISLVLFASFGGPERSLIDAQTTGLELAQPVNEYHSEQFSDVWPVARMIVDTTAAQSDTSDTTGVEPVRTEQLDSGSEAPVEAEQDTTENEPLVPADGTPAALDTAGMDALAPPEEESYLEIAIWPDDSSPGFDVAETDSTLRWFMALDWNERLYRQPGTITYRPGQLGHPTGLDLYGFENRHHRLMVNELDVTDPVTGQVNWSRLPLHRIRTILEDDQGWNYQSRVTLREHYMVQPKTYLNFDEGSGDYRNLEFTFTHNFQEKTNVELAFWDRRDGSGFRQTGLEGRQLVVRGRHHLNDRTLLKIGYLNNGLNLDQSFGYQITDPFFYDFNPFTTAAVEPNASSNQTTNDLYLQVFQRRNSEEDPHRAAGINYQTDHRALEYSQDTTAYSMRDLGLFAWQELQAGPATFRARGDLNLMNEAGGGSIPADRWFRWRGSVRGDIPFTQWLRLRGEGGLTGRSDGQSGYESAATLTVQPIHRLELDITTSAGSTIPTLQALYWQSVEYQGQEALSNETGQELSMEARIQLSSTLQAGGRAGIRENRRAIFTDPNGQFTNIDPYETLYGTAWIRLDSRMFEGALSATARQFQSGSAHPVNRLLDESGQPVWLKGSLYWKNYLFNRAAFVKAGLSGMVSPTRYRPSSYQVPLNRWQHGTPGGLIPDFHRLDLDMSARIRWFMLLVRYENLLDGVGQPGYFEAERYPMPGRRLLVGIRVVFTN